MQSVHRVACKPRTHIEHNKCWTVSEWVNRLAAAQAFTRHQYCCLPPCYFTLASRIVGSGHMCACMVCYCLLCMYEWRFVSCAALVAVWPHQLIRKCGTYLCANMVCTCCNGSERGMVLLFFLLSLLLFYVVRPAVASMRMACCKSAHFVLYRGWSVSCCWCPRVLSLLLCNVEWLWPYGMLMACCIDAQFVCALRR